MKDEEDYKQDIIDDDLYEEFDDEELYELVQEEKRKALERSRMERETKDPKRPFPKWIFWVIAFMMVAAILPNTFSIPAVDFLVKSAQLSTDDQISEYKQAVVVVEGEQSRGTGFAISDDGTILTNHHVIEDARRISVAFPEQGLFEATVIEEYPEVDLAVLKADAENVPHLNLADQTDFVSEEPIYFIGNPLRFTGIANEGEIIGYTDLSDWDQPVLMLDAPIYRGNSGSPVINQQGDVIGVVFATLNHEEEGRVGLAVPIDYYQNRP
ncbi:serine protease [Halobacillus fulvus]|nr:serine protease [Halobacillus fulvus]